MPRKTPLWLTAAFVLVVIFTAVVAWHHEAWRDEADTWLLMRDGGIRTMLDRTAYAGTPSLWYLLIAPFAAAALPFQAQQILNLLIAWVALWLFVYKAPFRPWVKLAFLFCYFAAYEYSVISRPYSLLMALLFVTAAVWPERMSKPLRVAAPVSLLANVATQGTIIAAAIGVTWLYEAIRTGTIRRRPAIAATLIMFGSGCVAAWQLWLPRDGTRVLRHVDPTALEYAIGAMVLPFTDPRISFGLGLLLLLFVILAAGRQAPPLLFLTIASIGLLALYQFVWYGGVRHSGIMLIVLIVSLWMAASYEAAEPWRPRAYSLAEAVLAISLAASIPLTFRYWRDDFRLPFSGSREMASYIGSSLPPNVVIAAHPPNECEPILAYLPGRRFWYVSMGQAGSYMKWGRELDQARLRPCDPPAEVRRRFGAKGWVLVVAGTIDNPEREGLHLLHRSSPAFGENGESYSLYAPVTGPH